MSEFFGLKVLAKTGAVFAVLALGVMTDTGMVAPAQAQAVASFSRIDVSGNIRIASDTVRVIANLPTGVDVTPGQINEAKQRLIASGLFESVDIYPDRGRLVISVVENPTINQINIEGNRRLKDEILLPLLQSQSRRAFSPVTAEQDARGLFRRRPDCHERRAETDSQIRQPRRSGIPSLRRPRGRGASHRFCRQQELQ